jgi:cell division protein FtsW (lipid II flippase)
MASRRLILQLDKSLLVVVLMISALGVYNLASAGRSVGGNLHILQAQYMALGIILMILTAAVDYRSFEGLAVPLYVTVLVLLGLTATAGKVVNGSRRWLAVGPINLQTSDMAKIAVILLIARMFHLHRREGGGLTLNDIFRPFNLSRPLLIIGGVLVLELAPDVVKPAQFKQHLGGHSRTVARLRPGEPSLLVGRGVEADIQLPYTDVEARHAELIRVDKGSYAIRDLDSEAGTYLNGERISGERIVHDGDDVRFGLNQRAELSFSDTMQHLRPKLPWLAVLGVIWLVASIVLQLKRSPWTTADLVAPIDVVVVPCGFILAQPDLGTSLVVALVAFTIILYVGVELLSLLMLSVFSVAGGYGAWKYLLKPYQKDRILTFLDPDLDPAGAGYHQAQSLIAIGSGGLQGKGHGLGTQTQFSFLPEQQTDFIFSVWAEEQGFVGCFVLVVLFAVLVALCFRVAANAKDRFGALVAIGVTALIFWHTVINMLMVTRLAPVVGVPLPLFSHGGSFVVTIMLGIGIVLNVGMRRYVF